MSKNPILDLPLSQVMRSEIALPLQHVLRIYTVGSFLNAWKNPKSQRTIEQCFDNPQQARQAATVCAAWLGVPTPPMRGQIGGWWRVDDHNTIDG